MRGADLGFAVVLGVAGLLTLVGLVIFPPGRLAGAYPTLTAWGPAAAVVLTVLALWAAAAIVVAGSLARAIPAGDVIFGSDGGFAALGLALLPLAVGPLFLAGAVDQIGQYGARGGIWALVSGGLGIALLIAGFALGYTREEVRLGGGVLTVISGRGLPSIRSWPVQATALEITKVVTARQTSWKVEVVDPNGDRHVVGRASTLAEAEARAARIRASR